MNPFRGLLVKELKIMKSHFYGVILTVFFAVLIGFALTHYFKEGNILPAFLFALFFAHILFYPIFILYSLNFETKTQGWLHNPNRGSYLLSSKLVAISIYFVMSIVITIFLAIGSYYYNPGVSFYDNIPVVLPLYLLLFITCLSFYFGLWFCFYWFVYYSLKNVPILGRVRSVSLFIIVVVQMFISGLIGESDWYKQLVHMSELDLNVDWLHFNFFVQSDGFTFNMADSTISIVEILLYIVTASLLFITSTWLLEKKVEV
ncbi:hypothetical protein MKX29_16295 [Cytobacillus sp. FSL R7-0696]|uniref:hypothetical protein n=1 Tax=Cytobacillus sp. FSL R7-0696 TaxID=2921691 RepID=UPI0030F77D0A